MNKKIGALIIQSDEHLEMMLKDGEKQEFPIERGLVIGLPHNIGEILNNIFNGVSDRGYFVCGFIINEDEIELIFQRHPEQSTKNKMVEDDKGNELKYKL